ncbi:MAG: bifunctional (p)ppGpp synthetase/guanosine-3',5'-bis(diphosphate) 3'-pyrophosphohydrolase [Acidobacteria bacterium]|nr:bifunctional (p)ppGpp synthetase/guanosine-3',5'-bis(diphosphate) 3'-pyrophosphohydrolase [Acidobacteriota bacterium]
MVHVHYSLNSSLPDGASLDKIGDGLLPADAARIRHALEFIEPIYAGNHLGTGEEISRHVFGMALIATALRLDADTRLAALLFAVHEFLPDARERIEQEFSADVARLVEGLHRLSGLRLLARAPASGIRAVQSQQEVLRKMVLAMVEDIRVVLLRLASRTQTLRYYTEYPGPERDETARESLDLYAPLANRLGVWEVKWEIEDLSFSFLYPDIYRQISRRIGEKRSERERFISEAVALLRRECEAAGIRAEIYGRPKHIYSIWKKMHAKQVQLEEIHDLRALRVIVDNVRDCYTVLGIVHQMWTPLAKEFDDYIIKPKGNLYQSLHTAVLAGDERPMEVQIRTWEMHEHAELGVAAHWRYKEGDRGTAKKDAYGNKVALLRELLSWRDEIADSSNWIEQFKRAALDDTIYIMTPQGRVIDLPRGSTPLDFAFRVHTEIGHRCRGAKADGVLVALNKPLISGQTVEIIAAKQGGPSRDWLNPQLGYLKTARARHKVKQYFIALDETQIMAEGRAVVLRELQRVGATQAGVEALAVRLGYANADAMFLAAGRDELGPRAIQLALREPEAAPESTPEFVPRKSKAGGKNDGVLIVGMDKLLTQLGRCCKPAPPDPIQGYITRGKGISIHRTQCPNFAGMARLNPERVIAADWGDSAQAQESGGSAYPVDISVECADRTGLLRDITEVLSRESINVTAVNTKMHQGTACLHFTLEVTGIAQLQRALKLLGEIPSVRNARRL